MSDPFYRTATWRRLREATLARDPVCVTRGCDRASTHADHIVPRARGGADVLDNLRGLCTSCHNRRSASGNADPRAIGCDASGLPNDPAHPFFTDGKSLGAGGSDRPGSRPRTKFQGRRGG